MDEILIQELREDEPQWVVYDEDELAVKMQLAETLFENLLLDTAQSVAMVMQRKAQYGAVS